MSRRTYTKETIESIQTKVQTLISIVNELEQDFGRHFTLDGHLIGSIGEVLSKYYYGLELYEASEPIHDGYKGNRKIQIKMTQGNSIVIREMPEYLIVLYLTKNGKVYEVYNGPGENVWSSIGAKDGYNNYHLRINKLMILDREVRPEERIEFAENRVIEKLKDEYKNPSRRNKKD